MEKVSLIKENFKSFFRLGFFLFLLIPVALVTGPLITEIFAILLILIFFFLIFKKKNYSIFRKYNFIIFVIFYLYLVFISFFSEDIFLSLKSSLFYFRFGFFYIAACYFLEYMDGRCKKIIYFLFFFIFLIFFDALLQMITGFNILNQKLLHASRASSFFGDELIMGSYTVRMLPIIICLIYFFKIEKLINLLPLLWVISIGTILLSGEKNSLGLMIILSIIYLLFSNFSYKKKIIALLLVIFSFLIFINVFPQIKKRIFYEGITNASFKYGFSRPHYSHYMSSYLMFLDKPIVGHGPKAFRVLCADKKFNVDKFSCSTHPHNMYFQLLSETGFIGFLFVLSLWSYSAFRLLFLCFNCNRNDYNHQYVIFASAGIFINLFPVSTSGNIFNNWLSYVYFLSISLFVYSLKNYKIKKIVS